MFTIKLERHSQVYILSPKITPPKLNRYFSAAMCSFYYQDTCKPADYAGQDYCHNI